MTFDDIKLEAIPMGRDLLLTIGGGEVHIGAASTAYEAEEGIVVQTSAVPGHKEHTLSEEFARRAAAALNRTVTVVMGIHYDDLSKAEIVAVSQKASALLDEYLQEVKK
ncbi:prenylated flavin chaperone LpdD [Paenibacillus sp. TH7-28]